MSESFTRLTPTLVNELGEKFGMKLAHCGYCEVGNKSACAVGMLTVHFTQDPVKAEAILDEACDHQEISYLDHVANAIKSDRWYLEGLEDGFEGFGEYDTSEMYKEGYVDGLRLRATAPLPSYREEKSTIRLLRWGRMRL